MTILLKAYVTKLFLVGKADYFILILFTIGNASKLRSYRDSIMSHHLSNIFHLIDIQNY